MKGSDFVFNIVDRLYSKCRRIGLDCGRSYIDFPDWTNNKNYNKP